MNQGGSDSAPMRANRPGLEPGKGSGSISSWEEIMGNEWRKRWIIVGKDGSDFNHSTSCRGRKADAARKRRSEAGEKKESEKEREIIEA
eukprot:scaffold119361_cov53-Attheya_sp.AAC.1